MTERPEDLPNTLEEILRHVMESIQAGDTHPVFIGIQIVMPNGQDITRRGDATEPAIEVHSMGDRIVLATEMPGVAREDIHLLFRDDRVFVWARDQERHYKSSAQVPPAQEGSEEITYRNGVLEVTYLPLFGTTREGTPGDAPPAG